MNQQICFSIYQDQDRKKNSMVLFLEEVLAGQFVFNFYWPLRMVSLWHPKNSRDTELCTGAALPCPFHYFNSFWCFSRAFEKLLSKNLLTESLKKQGKNTQSFFCYCRPFQNLNSVHCFCGADFRLILWSVADFRWSSFLQYDSNR